LSLSSLQLITKSLSLDRLRLALVGSISLIIAINATFVMEALGGRAAALVPVLVFTSSFLPTLIVLMEMRPRYNQRIPALRTIGAKKSAVRTAILVALTGAAFAGASVGVVAGLAVTGVTAFFSPPSFLQLGVVQVVSGTAYILVSCVAGVAAGVLVGVGETWDKSA